MKTNMQPVSSSNIKARQTAPHKAVTPEERATRFSNLATARTRRAIRGIRHIGDLVTGYAIFNEAQTEAIKEALESEVLALHGAMLARLSKGTTIKDVDFQV